MRYFWCVITLAMTCFTHAETVELRLDSGIVVGTSEQGVNIFKGVPYAQPPLGELRWQPPQEITWAGKRDATHYALPCLQPTPANGSANPGGVAGPTSEDCLYLNVWAPKQAEKAPVMVWLHGGAGYLGAGSLPSYDGTSFARDGVIVITINYRLGMLGQFAHPALTRAAKPGEPLANYQLMDTIAALKWVQRNGEVLGADTQNITLFGQSAGGVLVSAMLSVASAKGLFHKAIIQSGALLGGGRTLAQAEADGIQFATALGLSGADAMAAELRSLPIDKINAREMLSSGFHNGSYLIVDGQFRTTTTRDAFAQGEAFDIPLMAGSNSGEPGASGSNAAVALAASHGEAPAWHYHFAYIPDWRTEDQPNGAIHSAELPYVFDTLDLSSLGGPRTTKMDRAVARSVHSCWFAFAKASATADSLTCADGFVWQARTAENNATAVFAEKPTIKRAKPLVMENAEKFPLPPGIGEP